MKHNRPCGFGVLIFIIFAVAGPTATAAGKPNVLIIMADDLTYTDLPLYGGDQVDTPNIDRLAQEGLTFNRAYVSEAMCYPSRMELYTGLYPVRNGAAWNHSAPRKGVNGLSHYLKNEGYRVALAGKKHVDLPFKRIDGITSNAVGKNADFSPDDLRSYMARDMDQPFCLVAAFTLPHGPWTEGNPDQFDPEELDLPPYFISTPKTRTQYAKYLAEVEVFDQQVGRLLDTLEETGKPEDTLVLFTSEQGFALPGAKWTLWNPGVHTALVARWPGHVEAGQRTDALVQYADVLPTLIDLAGGTPENHKFDGSSFLPVLLGQRDEHRDYAYFIHNNVPEGPPYPIRGATDGEYHYIRNLTPDRTYVEKHMYQGKYAHSYWFSWIRKASTGSEDAAERLQRFMNRPAEELYHTPDDPHHMNNLAAEPEYQQHLERLSDEVDEWMNQQGDPGAKIDSIRQLKKARNRNHFERNVESGD